jgi:tetratricopeptide (TPR) repeat protein
LLSSYDRVLDGLADGPRRRRLLQDAASVARDSGNIARAASYLRALLEAAPGTIEVSSELEHLLEKLGDFATLAQVLTLRLAVVSGNDAIDVRQRLAGLYLDHLGQPDKALDEIEKILAQPSLTDDGVPCALADRVLADAKLPAGRAPARPRHSARAARAARPSGRRGRGLRVALTFATPEETRALVNEAADMLERKGDLAAAREQLVELVAFQPEEASTRARLKFLAEVTARPRRTCAVSGRGRGHQGRQAASRAVAGGRADRGGTRKGCRCRASHRALSQDPGQQRRADRAGSAGLAQADRAARP